MSQKMEDRTFKTSVGPTHPNATGAAQDLRADQTFGISVAVKFHGAGAISAYREPSENVGYIMSFAASTCGQVTLPRCLSFLKRRLINYRRVVTRNGGAQRDTFLAPARIALRLMLSDCRPIPQHTVNCRMIPFRRRAKTRNVLSVEMFGDAIAAKPSDAKLKDLSNDLSSIRHKNEGVAILGQL